MALSQIITPPEGFPHEILEIFAKKHYVYIAKGTIDQSDIPATSTALKELFEGALAPFKPMGTMGPNGSRVKSTQNTIPVDFGKVGTGFSIEGSLNGFTFVEDSIRFVDSLGMDKYSLLFIPKGDGKRFCALSGVTITTETDIGIVDDDPSKIIYHIAGETNTLADMIIYRKFAA